MDTSKKSRRIAEVGETTHKCAETALETLGEIRKIGGNFPQKVSNLNNIQYET